MNRMISGEMNKVRKRVACSRGMTMAEVLVVVAIICILAGVAFIAVFAYQRSLAQTERDAIAKEIFVAAQNHLTMAKGEGYLGTDYYGLLGEYTKGESILQKDDKKTVYYYAVDKMDVSPGETEDMFDQMLPFGSIDETVRAGGSYIIRYQPESALVLDVFYCSEGDKFGHKLENSEYDTVMDLRGDKEARKKYDGSAVLGWYGGADAANLKEITLKAPTIIVNNADTLHVLITDEENTNYEGDYSLRLLITGVTSKVQHYLDIDKVNDKTDLNSSNEYKKVLDDITKKNDRRFAMQHFCEINYSDMNASEDNNGFIPGEDITIQAMAYSIDCKANIAMSEEKITNSLFAGTADLSSSDGIPDTAYVENIRHLENIDKTVSKLGNNGTADQLNINKGIQIHDLDWNGFLSKVEGDRISYGSVNGDLSSITNERCFKPVDLGEMSFVYSGSNHSITGIKVDDTGMADSNGGLFKSAAVCTLEHIKLIDFDIKSNNVNAGALAGSLTDTTVKDVIAINNRDSDSNKQTNISGAKAGGLIGSMSGGRVEHCAAALNVKGTGKAGGLIGEVTDATPAATVTGSFSGGHTDVGEYYEHNDDTIIRKEPLKPVYNITATDSNSTAGGLIGDAGNSSLSKSYSTCSVDGTIAGGLVGSASGSISNCYCTGLVNGTNAFIGKYDGTNYGNVNNNQYLSIINEVPEYNNGKVTSISYKLSGIVTDGKDRNGKDIKVDIVNKVTPFDETTEIYKNFDSDGIVAYPYDPYLIAEYSNGSKEAYYLKSVNDLEKEAGDPNMASKCFINEKHYGDWPAPETLVRNKQNN